MKGIKKIQLSLWVLVLLIIIPLIAFGTEGRIEIVQTPATTFPIIFDQPGNYVLMSDLIVSDSGTSCLQIDVDGVAVDLNGYNLIGPGQGESSNGSGIYASDINDIAVINGTIEGFWSGISLSGVNHELKNIHVCNNSSCGIKINSSIISDCTADSNGSHGFDAESCTITRCTADNNGSYGLYTNSSTIINCTAQNNHNHGIHARGKCRLEGCIVTQNDGYGLYLTPEYSYAVKNGAKDNALGNFYKDGLHYLPISGDEANYDF